LFGFAVSEIKCIPLYDVQLRYVILTSSQNSTIFLGITLILKGQSVSNWLGQMVQLYSFPA